MKYIYFFLSIIFLTACTEKTSVNLVSGTLYQDCNNLLPNKEVALKANITGSFTEPIILGSAIVDERGNFNFTYELEEEDTGLGDLILITPGGFETVGEDIPLNEDVSFNFYRENITEVSIQLAGNKTYTSTDTLYYSFTNISEVYSLVNPSNRMLDTLYFQTIQNYNAELSASFYYGINSAQFERAAAAATNADSTFQNIHIAIDGCSSPQNIYFEINE